MSVQLGANLQATIINFIEALNSKDFDFECTKSNEEAVIITPRIKSLPRVTPQLFSTSEAIAVTNLLTEQLKSFHDET